MPGLTDYLTEQIREDTLIASYVLVADRLNRAAQTAKFVRTRGPAPEYDDAQTITIALAADYWFDGDEEKALHFLRHASRHPTLWLNGIPDTSRFNVQRRELAWVIEALRGQFRDERRQQRRAALPNCRGNAISPLRRRDQSARRLRNIGLLRLFGRLAHRPLRPNPGVIPSDGPKALAPRHDPANPWSKRANRPPHQPKTRSNRNSFALSQPVRLHRL